MKLAKLERTVALLSTSELGALGTPVERRTGRWLMRRNERIRKELKYTCAMCGRITEAVDVDHVIPLYKGGPDEDHNLQLLCSGPGLCHEIKTLKDRKDDEA
jgi:5-methylcytosine-specific restriction enzyme A